MSFQLSFNINILLDVLGYFGSFLIILAYSLISLNKVKSTSFSFQFLNFTGGILVLVNSWYYGAFPSVVISIFWILIAGFAIVKHHVLKK